MLRTSFKKKLHILTEFAPARRIDDCIDYCKKESINNKLATFDYLSVHIFS